ncbi:MAG: hypothetical protein HY223_00635 [Thaumarchaeota archaeon]|nr:hypothetical protein [Nitrososphaerota archaeon]
MFEKHCQICGMDVKKESAIKRFGKYFCNEQHAEDFLQMKKEEEERRAKEPSRGGGCC